MGPVRRPVRSGRGNTEPLRVNEPTGPALWDSGSHGSCSVTAIWDPSRMTFLQIDSTAQANL